MNRADYRRSRRSGLVALLCAVSLAAQGGCSMTHAKRRAAAEQHWNSVRAKIKLQLARQQFEHGLVEDSERQLEEALGWDPTNADAFILLARCQLEQGKVAAARRSVEEAAQLTSDNADLAFVRGVVAERSEQYEDALACYRQARLLDDTVVDYLIAEAECLVATGVGDEAVALLEDHLVDYDQDPSIHALLGEIALREGDDGTAATEFRTVLSAGRYDPLIAEQYALLAVRLGQYSDALTVLQPLMNDKDNDFPSSVVKAIAQCMLGLDRAEGAKMTLSGLLKDHPDDLLGWFLLAQAGIQSHDMQTTRRSVSNLVRIAPHDSHTLLMRAYADLIEDNLLGAEQSLHALLVINDEDPLVHCLLGQVAERAGDRTAAREHYQRALQIDPTCRLARAALTALSKGEQTKAGDAVTRDVDQADYYFAAGTPPQGP